MPAGIRPAIQALFEADAAMGDVVARSTDPALGKIVLAWWREQLQALAQSPPPAEPRLRAVSEHLLERGIKGAELAELEIGWATLLDAEIDPKLVAERGSLLFALAARLLGAGDDRLNEAGALYALSSVESRGVPELREPANGYLQQLRGYRFDRRLRPLTMLARGAARGGGRSRALAMLAHRWSGRIG
jgi:phytoene synthase